MYKSGLYQSDTVIVQIPEGHILESKPKPVDIVSGYGSFQTSLDQDSDYIKYVQTLEVKPGRYPASQYSR